MAQVQAQQGFTANAQGNAAAPHPQQPVKLEIVGGSSGTCFFVTGVHGNEETKKALKSMGGHHNAHVKGYRFPVSKLEEVCKALNMSPNVNLVDPRKVITVEFTQEFQWPEDMSVAEQKLKEIGLHKKGGKNNAWTGDLSMVNNFFTTFNFGK